MNARATKTILYIHQSADLYGSDKVLLALVKKLDREKFLPIVFLPVEGPLLTQLVAVNVECHVLPISLLSRGTLSFRGLLLLPIKLIESIRGFTRALKGRHIDLVHSNTLAVLSGAIWAKIHHVPHVWHVHEIILRPKFVRVFYAFLLNWFADVIICISHATKDNLVRDKPTLAGKIHVVWNGLDHDSSSDPDAVRQYRQQLNIQKDDVLVALVGRVNRWKGQQVLVKAAGILWQEGLRNLKFVIVGSVAPGQEVFLDALQHAISESAATPSIELQPFTLDVWTIWNACDIAVIPSTEPEPFGLVALEAMVSSKPVVAANHGGLAEIVVQGETGLLVPPGDEFVLADAIKRLAANVHLRRQMGESGLRRYRSEFTLDRHVENISKIYEKSLAL